MSIFNEIEILSKRYWSHEHKRHRVSDLAFDDVAENFILILRSITDNNQTITQVALKELWGAALLLHQTVGRDTAQLTIAANRITNRVKEIIEMNRERFGDSLELIESQISKINRLCNNPNVGILKGTVISRLISENPDSIVVAKHYESIKGLKSIVDEVNPTTPIFTFDDLPSSSTRNTIILPCWPGHKSVDKLARASLADKYLIAGYDQELAGAESYFNKEHSFPSKNILSVKDKKGMFPSVTSSWPIRPILNVSEKASEVEKMVEQISKTKKHYSSHISEHSDENTEAFYCDLSGDFYAYLTEGFTPNLIIINGETVSVKEITMKDLDEGQLLMFRGESEDGAVQSVVENTHPESKELRKIAKIWEEEIKTRFKRPIDLYKQAKSQGFKISYQSILIWHGGWLRIAPEEKNLEMLAIVLGPKSQTAQQLESIKGASQKLGEWHLEAGQIISNALKNKITELRDRINEYGASIKIPSLGQIQIVQIETIENSKQTIARNYTNKLLKQ
jgi:hypothetical protein